MASIKNVAALALFASTSFAVDLGAPLVGCAEVDCPTAGDNTTSAECTLASATYNVIGLGNIDTSSSISADGDLSWTEGVSAIANSDNTGYTFEKDFYLGTPPNFNMSGTGGCALFLAKVSDKVVFPGNNTADTVGTCADAMSQDCVDALVKQATDAAGTFGKNSTQGACQSLQNEFLANLPDACSIYAENGSWGTINVADLTIDPLTSAENSSSNCYPTLPKTNDLTNILSFNTTSDNSAAAITTNLYAITPILTLFYPGNGTLISKPEAQLTCMKANGETDAANSTESSTDDNTGAGAHTGVQVAVLAFGVAASLFLTL